MKDDRGGAGLDYGQQVLFAWRVSLLLLPLNDGSGDIADDEGSF